MATLSRETVQGYWPQSPIHPIPPSLGQSDAVYGPRGAAPSQTPCTQLAVGTRQLDLQAVLWYSSTSPSQTGSSTVCVLDQNHIPPRVPRWPPAREGQRSRPRWQMKHSWVRLLLFLVLPSAAHSVLVPGVPTAALAAEAVADAGMVAFVPFAAFFKTAALDTSRCGVAALPRVRVC